MAGNSKAQEALQYAEASAAPPPPYKERASIVTETDDFQIIDEQDCYPEDEKRPIEGSNTTPHPEEKILVDMPTRTPSMLKEKGPVYPPRPSKEVSSAEDQQEELQLEDSKPLPYPPRPSKEEIAKAEQQQVATTPEDSKPLPSAEDEKAALKVHFAIEEEETPPPIPRRPSASRFSEDFSRSEKSANMPPSVQHTVPQQSNELPLEYTFTWHRPILDFPSLHITPTPNVPIHSNSPSMPPTTSWKLIYTSKYQAGLHRYGLTQTTSPPEEGSVPQMTEYPFRQLASYKFPDFIIPGTNSGVKVLFEPHEEELARLGNLGNGLPPVVEHDEKESKKEKKKDKKNKRSSSSGSPQVQKFMQCTGWFSTKYTMEIPVLGHMQATFKTIPRPRTSSTSIAPGPNSNYAPPPAPQHPYGNTNTVENPLYRTPSPYPTNNVTNSDANNIRLVTIGDLIDQARAKIADETFTPYPQHHLIVEFDGREVATYQRAAPWAKTSGKLIINKPEIGQVYLTPEFIEGIIIATVAMAGMQERIGLASGLMEAMTAAGEGVRDGVVGSSGSPSGTGANGGMMGRGKEEWRKLVEEWKRRNQNRAGGGMDWRVWNYYGNGNGQQQQQQQQQERPRGGVYLPEHEGHVVGSEVFDDGLGGVLTPQEREAARREQMAWDTERARTNRQVHFASPPETSPQATTPTPTQQNAWSAGAQKWEEKPKVVYA
ncbi:hypothetical protein CBER1_03670 [Cercospora berteroae]|uniref:Uncharacterized protein n=1 Tax=Cercospora berteroae TaxID=357750 RepID=A0A2S6CLJ7_9PEZI|nr:hypothetical protein CBER1_03670 [Cercospora berteroae]